jgi:hypothetical protein
VQATAGLVLRELEAHRATWQSWHVYAEAQRHVRDVAVPVGRVARWCSGWSTRPSGSR